MNLMEARARRRITQLDLGLLTGLSQSKISLIERGYIVPTETEEKIILSSLGMKKDEIHWLDRRKNTKNMATSEI